MLNRLKKVFFFLFLFILLIVFLYWIRKEKNPVNNPSQQDNPPERDPNPNEEDWGEIHPDFKNNPELIEEWKKTNSNYRGVEVLISEGWFKPDEALFYSWMIDDKNKLYYRLSTVEFEEIREEFKNSKKDILRERIAGCFHTWKFTFERPAEEKKHAELVMKNLRDKQKSNKECYFEVKKMLVEYPSYKKNMPIMTSYLDYYLKEWVKLISEEL